MYLFVLCEWEIQACEHNIMSPLGLDISAACVIQVCVHYIMGKRDDFPLKNLQHHTHTHRLVSVYRDIGGWLMSKTVL